MSRKIRLLCICGIIAFALVAPGFALAQEAPAPATEVVKSEQSPRPGLSISQDEKPMTLEELKKALGPRNVCGASPRRSKPSLFAQETRIPAQEKRITGAQRPSLVRKNRILAQRFQVLVRRSGFLAQ